MICWCIFTDPKLLMFIKSKRAEKSALLRQQESTTNEEAMEVDITEAELPEEKATPVDNEEHKSAMVNPLEEFKDVPGMNIIEDDKLQWMKEAPTPVWKDEKVS